jgi:uncharacterized protein (UPF0332 family)
MRFDWSEYFNLAQELAVISSEATNNEARLRSAVSRAYYSVFFQRSGLEDSTSTPDHN